MLVPKVNNQFGHINPSDNITLEVNENSKIRMESVHEDIFFIESSFEKYIKYIEKIVRNSFEYRSYIWTLKNEFEINRCKFLKDIDTEKTLVTLEFHHYPFTLYDIVYLTIVDKINKYGNFESNVTNCWKLAEEIVKLHYENKVGLVPLTETVHELVHNGLLFIPLNKDYVFADYMTFFNSISECETKEIYKNKLNSLKDLTKEIEDGKKENDISILNDLKVIIKMSEAIIPQKISVEEGLQAI